MALDTMSSNKLSRYLGFALIACVCSAAAAKAAAVCPARPQDAIQQIYLFDGAPEDLAYLAPDNDTNASNRYSVKAIYSTGRFVTVRCKYKSGSVVDVELKERIDQCTFRKDHAGYGNLRCR